MKLNQMIEDGTITAEAAKIGYVGAFPFAEVISGYTSFFLGARSVCPSATMEVRYTNSWSDMALEKETAEALIADGLRAHFPAPIPWAPPPPVRLPACPSWVTTSP